MRVIFALLLLMFASLPARAGTWCSWTNAPYTGWARLSLPGGTTPWASVGGDAISLTGALQDGADGPVLRAQLERDGVRVSGDLRGDEGLVFRTATALPFTSVGFIAEGAQVVPTARLPLAGFRVMPTRAALHDVKIKAAPGVAMSCPQLLLSGRFNEPDESAALMAALGVTASTERAWLKPGRVPVRMEPGFPRGVTLKKVPYEREVAVLERRGGDARIALGHYDGVVWIGWIKARQLQPVGYAPTGGLGGILGSLGGGAGETVRTCDVAMPLRVKLDGRTSEVGSVGSGVPFVVKGQEPEGLSVELRSTFLSPEDSAILLLPGEASDCASREVPPMSLDQIFQESVP